MAVGRIELLEDTSSFNPGDLLARSSTGQIRFGGRSNDVFLFCGVLVSPFEIEDVLRERPDVADCVAFGAPASPYGAIPMAAVMLSGSARAAVAARAAVGEAEAEVSREIAAQLRDHCRELLGFRSAKQVVIVEDVPRGPTGKPLRRVLAEQFALRS